MESNRCIGLFVVRSEKKSRRSKKVVFFVFLPQKLSCELLGRGGVGRVWWWCGPRQLRRKELAKVVEVLGLDGCEGEEDT